MSATHVGAIHSVHIYDDDSSLISRVCAISAADLRVGDAVVVIATAEHREQLVHSLANQGIELPKYARPGRFRMFDAVQLLDLLVEHGWPERGRFFHMMDTTLRDAQTASRSKDRGLTVFGEMVSILWDQGDPEGALELEALWNDLLEEHAFHLHCAYPRDGLFSGEVGEVNAVCGLHSHVVMDTGEMAA